MGELFQGVIGGRYKVVRRNKRGSREGDREKGISKGEILEPSKRLKEGKAAGIDVIPGEVWYRGEKLERLMEELLNKVWRSEEWPES